jgi:hypothetical protein
MPVHAIGYAARHRSRERGWTPLGYHDAIENARDGGLIAGVSRPTVRLWPPRDR